jgi:hypothetical protein
MPEWLDGVAQELSLIGAAPISFAIALVVVIIVVWAILHWFYHQMLSSKDIQIEVLQSRLADYRNVLEGASPREAAYKITQLKGKLEAIKGVPRDENAIFQNGKRIGEVVGVRIDPPNNSVVFDRMVIAGHLDQASHVEFKNLVLAFVGLDGFSQTRQGRTLVNAQFSIVGNRRDRDLRSALV